MTSKSVARMRKYFGGEDSAENQRGLNCAPERKEAPCISSQSRNRAVTFRFATSGRNDPADYSDAQPKLISA